MRYIDQIYQLWHADTAARRRFQISAIVTAFTYGIVNSAALGRPERQVTWETLALICFMAVAFSVFYCVWPRRPIARFEGLSDIFHNRKLLGLGLAFGGILLAVPLASNFPGIKRAILDLQLRMTLYSPHPFDPGNSQRITEVVRDATAAQIALDPHLVSVAANKFLEAPPENPRAWQTTLAFLDYRSALNIQVPVAPIKECISVPDDARGITGSIINGRLLDCFQTLDHIRWTDIVFENSVIVYHGGPVVLSHVWFKNCRFILDYSPSSQELGRSLIASNNVTITIPAS